MEVTYKRRIIDYFKKNVKKGYPIQTLKFALINQGYLRPMVEEAMEQAMKEMAREAPVLKETPKIEHEVVVDDTPVPVKKSWLRRLFGL
jgi:TPP-dependent pyruvate/acetoin dehydrogenase alpha subunit